MPTRRTFQRDLSKSLKNPEGAAHFANAQVESGKELLKCGLISSLDTTSLSGKVYHKK